MTTDIRPETHFDEERAIMEKELSMRDVLCIDCKYYQYIGINGKNECMNPKNLAKSLENGALFPRFSAGYLRDSDDRCGVVPKWFEGREE